MMRTHKVRTLMAAAALCCIGLFTTCKNTVGLGGTVDINPPTLDVSTIYPPAGAVIRDTFVLSIEAKDDSGIASVTANLTKTGLTEQPDSKYTSYSLEKAADGTHWTAHINKKDTEKGFPLTDGSYKVLLTATDTAGKTARTESTFTIDNTAPLLILNRPSTTTKDDSADVFGDGFLLVGQVYDDTPVAALTVTAKGTGEHDPVFTKSIAHVPQNIRLTVDAFSSDSMRKFYQGLYGSNQNAGPKSYTYNITVEDEAKVYQAPGDKGSGSGNTTNRYYLFDELYSEVLSEYRIQTVYNMMRGTYSSQTEVGVPRSAAEIEADQKKTAAVQAALQKAQLGGNVKRQGTFSLNPSLNPRFDIAGEIPVARPEAGGAPKFSRLYSGSTLTVKVSSNLDGVPLESADSYRFFLMEWQKFADFAGSLAYPTDKINGDSIYADAGRTTVKPEFIELTKSKAEKEGSSYIFSVPVSAEYSGLAYGKSYVLLVRGKDQGGKNKQPNELIPDFKGVRGGVYGFSLVKTGKAPEVFVTQINDTVGTGADGTITERVYLKKGDSLKFKIKLQPITARVTYTLQGAVGGDVSEAQTYTAGEHDVTIDKAKFNQDADGTYKLTVKAEADEGSSLEQTYHIVYDVKGPEVRIAFPTDEILLNGDDGKFLRIQGAAFDTGSGLAENPITVTLTKEGGSEQTPTVVKNGGSWETEPLNLSQSPYGDGKYTLNVKAKDAVGHETTETFTFIYDFAAPVINTLQINGHDVTDNPLDTISTTSNVTLSGNIIESYGLDVFSINGEDMPLSSLTFSKPLTLGEGSHDITIRLKDKAGKETSRTITAIVDTLAPVFQDMKIATQVIAATGQSVSTNSRTVAIEGKIKEEGSGVKKLEYQVEGITGWTELNAVKKNDGLYHFEGFAELRANAPKKVSLRVTDNANRDATWDCTVTVVLTTASLTLKVNDPASPTLFVNANGAHYRKPPAELTIHGTISNSATPVPRITVTVKKNGTPLTNLNDFFSDPSRVSNLKMNDPGSQTFTTTNDLAEGEYTITVSGGGADPKTVTLVIDKTGPAITAITPQNGGIITAGSYVQAALADISGIKEAKAYYQKEGDPVESISLPAASPYKAKLSTTPLAEGKYKVWFAAKDKLGNETTSPKMTVWNDSANPKLADIKVDGKTDTTVYSKVETVTVKGKATDEYGVAKVEILEGGTVKKDTTDINIADHTWSIDFSSTELTDGTHNLTIRATDKAGKTAEVQRTVVVDRSAPTLVVNPVSEGVEIGSTRWIKSDYIRLSGTVTDNVNSSGIERVEYSVDNGANWLPVAVIGTSWSAGVSLGAAGDGVKLRAVDKAGNISSEVTKDIKYDTKTPTLKITAPTSTVYAGPAGGSAVAVTYTAQDPAGGSGLKDNSTEIVILSSTDHEEKKYENEPNTDFTIPDADISGLPEGEKTVKISVFDAVGNKSAQAQFNLIVDKTAPTVQMLNPTPDATGWAKTFLVGKTTLNGSFTDTANGSGIDGNYASSCKIGKDKSDLLSGDTFTATTGSWTLEIADIGKYGTDAYSDQKYNGAGVTVLDGKIYKVPLYITAKDRSGNTQEQQFFIMVDSDGKTPKVTIQSPQQESTSDPDSAEAHNKLKKVTLGGIALFSGLSQTTNPASGAKITEIQARFSPKPDFTESFTRSKIVGSGTVDWKNGDTVVQSTGDSIFSWNFTVNCTAFLTGSAGGVQDLYYSIRAKNDAGDVCEWTPARIIKLDEKAPSFENSKVGPSGNLSTYIDGTFVKDGDYLVSEFMSTSGVTKIEITSVPEVSYLAALKTLNGDTAITGAKIDGTAVFTTHSSGGKSGYKMQLPIKTANLNDPDLNFKIKVTLTGGQANGSIPNFNQFVLRYDITKPAAIFGTPKGDLKKLHCTQMAASGVDISIPQNSSVTAEVTKLVKNIDNLYLFAETNDGSAKEIPLQGITETSGKVTVTFKTPPVTDVKADAIGVLIEKDPVVFKPSGSEYQVQGLAYDTGSGVKTVKASIGNKSVDISKFTSLLGSFVSFKESLLINDLPDGSNTLKLAVTDGAGNPGTESNSTVYLRNKPLKLNKVLFSTDLNGNNAYDTATAGVIESVEESGDGKNLDTRQNYVQTLDIAQKFTLKNAAKSQIKFTLDAGQSAKNFTMYKVAPTAEDPWALGTIVKSGSLADSSFTNGEINFKSTDFGSAADKIPDGDGQKFVIVLKDAASDTDTERKLTLRVTLSVKISDARQPSVFVAPFYWNGEGDNSLASNDRTKGHIEIKAVSGGAGKSDVSGAVVLRGTAYHPTKLTALTLTVGGSEKNASYTAGTWVSSDSVTVKDTRLDVNGHWVTWEYVWTTEGGGEKAISVKSKHNTVESDAAAGTATIARKSAQARNSQQSLTLAAGDSAVVGQFLRIVDATGSGDGDQSYLVTITSIEGSVVKWENVLIPTTVDKYYLYPREYIGIKPNFNEPTLTVNVVPYITGIVTKLDTAYSSNPSVFNRSAKGEYPVRNDEIITVKGFNLAPSSGNPTVSIGTTQGTSTANEIKVKLRSSDKSGNLDITVNGIKSINNLNSNAAYNMKPNGANNDLLNDDTKLHVWKFATVRTDKGVRYPTMRIGKDSNQTVGFVYGSGAQAMKMNLGGQDFGIDFSFTQWYDTGVAVDSSGKIYGAAMNGDSGADGTHSYNKHANFGFYAWNTYNVPGQTYNRYSHLKLPTDNGDGAYSRGLKKVALENSYDGVVFASNRIVSPKIATKGAGNVYMAYYDASQNTVKFRYGNVSGYPDTDGVQLTFSGGLGNHSNNGTGSAAGAVGIASGDTAGPYVAVGVVPTGAAGAGTALVAWYDPKNQRLLYKYSTSTSDYSSANWSDENIIDTGFVGWYVDLVADKDGGIHIAYYSAQNGDLKYAYLSKYDATPQTYFVDSYLSVGTNISIEVSDIKKTFTKYKVNADTGAITEDGTESRYVPYISSYMSSFMRTQNSVRVAWLADIKPDVIKDNTGKYKANPSKSFADGVKIDKYTGTWEAMTVPTTQIPLDYTVGVGIKKNTSNNQSVMLGYGTTAGLETAILE